MSKISESSIFYKPYLYYNLYIRYKALRKRNTYSQDQEDLFINDYFKEKIYHSYFIEGLDIGKKETLINIGKKFDIKKNTITNFFKSICSIFFINSIYIIIYIFDIKL